MHTKHRIAQLACLAGLTVVVTGCQHPGDRTPGTAVPVIRTTAIPTEPMIAYCGVFNCVDVEQR